MKIFVNAYCNKGGGIQVCDGLIRTLGDFAEYEFIVCASPEVMSSLGGNFRAPKNVKMLKRPLQTTLQRILGRYSATDLIIKEQLVDAVFTVFGPSYWRPNVPHLCGFAIPHYVIDNYCGPLERWPLMKRVKFFIYKTIQMHSFKCHADAIVVENPLIGKRLKEKFGIAEVYTVYNTCNQVFYDEKSWNKGISLPEFSGRTILTLASYYPHKNLEILVPTARQLREMHPDFPFRFVMSIERGQLKADISGVEDNFIFLGKVSIDKCPWLYRQSDLMLLPTLLECFSASWVESMVMEIPIITSDLSFAHGICEDAACYVDPTSPKKLAEAIYDLSCSVDMRRKLVENGKRVCLKFADARTRMREYLDIIEKLSASAGGRGQ